MGYIKNVFTDEPDSVRLECVCRRRTGKLLVTLGNATVRQRATMNAQHFVHIFVALGRFGDANELSDFVEPDYSDNGDLIGSQFMREIGLESYEPMAIEREFYPRSIALLSALAGFSYSRQFPLVRLADTSIDSIVCVYAPNSVQHPNRSSLDYVGAFTYDPNGE